MTSTPIRDEDVLIPDPILFKVGGEELRLAPLPVKRLTGILRFVETHVKTLEKLNLEDATQDGLAGFMEAEVFARLNELLRLLFVTEREQKLLTDDWCADHLSLAHYRAIVMAALKQNELHGLFLRAKGFLGQRMEAALRPRAQEREETPA